MAADGVNYKDLLIITSVIDGQLDIPFAIYSFTAVEDNHIHYDISEITDGRQVLAHVHVTTDDYEKAMSLPNVVKDFQNDSRVKDFWTITKAEFYGCKGDLTEDSGCLPYEEEDAAELAPFCTSSLME